MRKVRRTTPIGTPFKKGNPGRPKGTPNKLTRTAKENIEKVFDGMGGVDGMIKWAGSSERNRAVYYSEIYPKLLPLDVKHSGDMSIGFRILDRVVKTETEK